jgi:hypothetical protein
VRLRTSFEAAVNLCGRRSYFEAAVNLCGWWSYFEAAVMFCGPRSIYVVLRPRLCFGDRDHVLRTRSSFEAVVMLCGRLMARVFFRYLLPTERLQGVGEPSGEASSDPAILELILATRPTRDGNPNHPMSLVRNRKFQVGIESARIWK